MGKPESKCPRCEYSFPGYRPTEKERMEEIPYYCDYIGIMGHRKPCPPGAACTVFKPRTHEGHGAWRKKRKDALGEERARRDGKPKDPPRKARVRKGGKPIPPEVIERVRTLLLAGESTRKAAAQVGISQPSAWRIQQEMIAQGELKRTQQLYAVRTVWPRKEVFRGDAKACAAFLGIAEDYVPVARYRGQVVHGSYMIASVQTDTTAETERRN